MPLSRTMQALLTRYARYFNRKYGKVGHVFQSRYRAILCQKDRYLLELIRYIHLNPARAKLVKDPAGWRWSSHRNFMGEEGMVPLERKEVLSYFGKRSDTALKGYLEFMSEGIRENKFSPYPKESFPYLGDEKFIEEISKNYRELRRRVPERLRLSLDELAEKVVRRFNISLEDLKSGSKVREVSQAKAGFCYIANRECHHKESEIAQFLGLRPSSVTKAINQYRKRVDLKKREEEVHWISHKNVIISSLALMLSNALLFLVLTFSIFLV